LHGTETFLKELLIRFVSFRKFICYIKENSFQLLALPKVSLTQGSASLATDVAYPLDVTMSENTPESFFGLITSLKLLLTQASLSRNNSDMTPMAAAS